MIKKRFLLALTVLCFVPISLFAQTFKASGFQQFQIGDIQAVVLSDGYIPFASVQPILAPVADADSVSAVLKAQFRSTTSFELAMNILLLQKGDRLILFDAGYGSLVGDYAGKLIHNLALVGITPEQITDVIVTHAHRDHIGGLVDSRGHSVYSNASIYISRVEYDLWTKGKPDFSKSKLTDAAAIAGMTTATRSALKAIEPQLKKVEDGATVLDCIQLDIVAGHTDGHLVSTIFSKGEKLIAIADVVHSDAVLFAHPQWGIVFDSNFELGIASRLRVLKELSQTNDLIFGFHLPYPGIGRVKEIARNSYTYQPKAFFVPSR
ncbi:MAG: hypothetical protein RL662_988 [Bacteroidota bacterium]|jgi:glyoxylase-like metal-dependent hydrolase (beta-lactamase superfamily II)